ncbi:uncharacterized protein EURHEDRAFT_104152 [Aspergillus ruber CBS 135680]|uniref:Uncharacterized protein n=1 Tax=Aspergillus ruber (strain CBS 135680) TaxID=1388766 RepID=A0A017SCS1_ASPRC|nr:uncharacterized protein EURHEDRAFT_104152 [Aspergillus ruber CBS 135680]EYE94010.1 hypothetical protein EURHEDRAFT_104152 [Aspergillus ruber CBS 135680]
MSMTMPSVPYPAQYTIFLRLSSRSSGTDVLGCGHPRTNGNIISPSRSIQTHWNFLRELVPDGLLDTRSPLRSFTLEGRAIYFVSSESFQALAGGLTEISDADINGIIVGFITICALMFMVRVDLLSGPSGRTGAVLDVLSLQIAGWGGGIFSCFLLPPLFLAHTCSAWLRKGNVFLDPTFAECACSHCSARLASFALI